LSCLGPRADAQPSTLSLGVVQQQGAKGRPSLDLCGKPCEAGSSRRPKIDPGVLSVHDYIERKGTPEPTVFPPPARRPAEAFSLLPHPEHLFCSGLLFGPCLRSTIGSQVGNTPHHRSNDRRSSDHRSISWRPSLRLLLRPLSEHQRAWTS
jgi:hypothetical protein